MSAHFSTDCVLQNPRLSVPGDRALRPLRALIKIGRDRTIEQENAESAEAGDGGRAERIWDLESRIQN